MNILQVSSTDLIGKRFNGQYLTEILPSYNHEINHLVWQKEGHNLNTHEMLRYRYSRFIQKIGNKLEELFSIRALLHPYSFLLKRDKYFKKADVVHYHVMHWPNFFSILAFPFLTRNKPSVLTVHDLWPLTGHCVYPFECTRWKTGCGKCPNLKTSFEMKRDNTRIMWKIKSKIYRKSKLDIIVASKYMEERVLQSPFFKHCRIHHIPFGLDLNVFKPMDQNYSKQILGVGKEELIISFRAAPNDLKGFDHIKAALRNLKTNQKICLLTFNIKGQLEEFRSRFNIIDLGWVYDQELTLQAYNATDFFLMPSMQEAFGMMAMEAMAFGKPVVVFDGTSLPEIVGGKECGIVVPKGSINGLTAAIQNLIDDSEFRHQRSKLALKFAQENYNIERHIKSLIDVYDSAINNKH